MSTRAIVALLIAAVLGSAAPFASQPAPAVKGIELVTLPTPNSPLVAIRLMFRAGSIDDPKGKEGLSALTALMVGSSGTAKRTYPQLVDAMYPLAANIGVLTDREVTVFTTQVNRDTLPDVTALLQEVLLEPGFREEDFTRHREQLMAYLTTTLRSANDELLGLEMIQQAIYRAHPYGHASAGTIEGLKGITPDDVRRFYREHYTQQNLILGVSGGFPRDYPQSLATALGKLPSAGAPRVALPPPPAVKGRRITIIDKKTDSTGVHFGFPLPITRASDDFYPLLVANSFLGEHRTFHGRLMNELRGKRGLNYGDYSYIEHWDNPPGTSNPPPNHPRRQQYFSVWIRPVVPENASFALRAAISEVNRLVEKGLTKEEFELTREFLVSYSKLWARSLSDRLAFHMDSRYYGTPYYIDEIERRLARMTVEDVNRSARKYLQTENFEAMIVAGDAAALRARLTSDTASPITYANPVAPEVTEADKTIAPLPIRAAEIRILPVDRTFEASAPSAALAHEPASGPRTQPPAWVADSNRHAQVLLDVMARFAPEGAGQFGVEGLDEQISNLSTAAQKQGRQQLGEARSKLQQVLKHETHPLVHQDLNILIDRAGEALRGIELTEARLVQYMDVTSLVFGGLRALLDEQIAPARRPAAVVRLRKYAGLAPGFEPVTTVAIRRTREQLGNANLLPPARSRVERDLVNGPILVAGIEKLFERHRLEGWREPYQTLKAQLEEYQQFVKTEVLPKARTDFRLAPDLYQYALDQVGVDVPREKLAADARAAFKEIQDEMQRLAPDVAKARGIQSTNYRDVMRALKKEQLVGDQIMAHYRKRLEQIEAIVRRKQLVTLPERDARIRIATEAEAASTPAPSMRPPRLIGNTGEFGEFILPLNIPAPAGSPTAKQQYDDFTYEAASWTLTAHEARPGHEMQFAKMIEAGVSVPRAIFAFNSTNVEGWALYAEWMMLPHMPPDGQLVSLQFRLMRAARAFLDPELHMGKVTPDQARRTLREDVVLSEAMTEQEVERYMFRSPGQATSYFYGYTQLRGLRSEVERAQGARFEPRAFHDFILAQGLLPPTLLRAAVLERFAEQ